MGIGKGIKVVYFTRKQRQLGNFSVEIYFNQVRENLPEPFFGVLCDMPYESNGFFKRLANAIYCIFKQGDINHITGDIHYVATFLKKRRTILTILDCGMLHGNKGIKHTIYKLFWFTIPVKRASVITAISEATKQDIIRFTNCDEKKVHVVYVCINQSFHRSDKEFNSSKPRILQIGTAQNKNLQRLVPALKDIPCTLVVVGKMNSDLLEIMIHNYINYEMIDRKLSDEEILNEYRKCDIVSFVSTMEGFGMPIVEGNTVGRVVITGNNTSMPEVAANAAHLADPYSVDSMRQGFEKIISDEAYRNTLIINGYENCRRFLPKTIAVQFSSIYKAIGKN